MRAGFVERDVVQLVPHLILFLLTSLVSGFFPERHGVHRGPGWLLYICFKGP
jgi:hypothetical protein